MLTLISLYAAMDVWDSVAEREHAVATEGFMGTAVSYLDMLRHMTLGLVIAVATYYATYSLGETVDDLIGWFDGTTIE